MVTKSVRITRAKRAVFADAGVRLEDAVRDLVNKYTDNLNKIAEASNARGGEVDMGALQDCEARVGYIILLANRVVTNSKGDSEGNVKVKVTVYYKDVFIADIDNAFGANFSVIQEVESGKTSETLEPFTAKSGIADKICEALKQAQYRAIQRQQ